jgi:dienelactone hydrolase
MIRLLTALVALATPLAPAPVDRVEVIPFESLSATTRQVLTGGKGAKPVTIAGVLRLPRPGPDRVPVVVLMHGSAGINARQDRWVQELNAAGIATFDVDSFSGRGIQNTVGDQAQLSTQAMMIDAFRALALLRAHPRIDPERIAILGASKGGMAALYSATERFRKMYAPDGASFAVHVGLYAACNVTYREDDKVGKKPIRLFHGAADDWVLAAPCRDYVARLRKTGADVTLTEFEGAHHAYDSTTLTVPLKLPRAQTARKCSMRENADGEIVDARSGEIWSPESPCVERGTTVAYDPAATEATVRAVKEIVGGLGGAR